MGQWASCLTEGTLCLALPCKGRAACALLQMSPRLGQSPWLRLKGRGANGAVPERLPRGHSGWDSGRGGGYWQLEMRLGLVLGYGNAFGVESRPECWREGGYPPLFKRIPAKASVLETAMSILFLAWPCRSNVRPEGHARLFGATA